MRPRAAQGRRRAACSRGGASLQDALWEEGFPAVVGGGGHGGVPPRFPSPRTCHQRQTREACKALSSDKRDTRPCCLFSRFHAPQRTEAALSRTALNHTAAGAAAGRPVGSQRRKWAAREGEGWATPAPPPLWPVRSDPQAGVSDRPPHLRPVGCQAQPRRARRPSRGPGHGGPMATVSVTRGNGDWPPPWGRPHGTTHPLPLPSVRCPATPHQQSRGS